jgi:predicted TIM-barrel fold metal-dependent hydrolase
MNTAFEKARADVGVIDTMIGFPAPREEQAKHYDFIRKQTHDADSQEWEFPAQYMFKGVPHYDKVDDPVEMLMEKMNQHGITRALTGMAVDGNAKIALERYPDRFIASANTDPNQGMDAVRKLDDDVRVHGARSVNCWGTGLIPQVPLNDKKMYPIYSKCIELDIPIFVYAGRASASRRRKSRSSTRCAGSSPSSRSSRATAASRGASSW